MSGNIRKLDEGLYELRWDLPKDPVSGKRRTKTKRFRGGVRLAQKELQRLMTESEASDDAKTDELFSTVAREWLELKRTQLKPSTLREYERRLESDILPAIGHVPIAKLTPRHLDNLYVMYTQTHKAQHPEHIHRIISGILTQAVKWGWIDLNIAIRATLPRVEKTEISIASPDDLGRILECARSDDPMWERLIAFAALTGMRRGEICALRWTDIHADVIVVARSLVKIKGETHEGTTKTHQVRRIALDPLANGILTAQLNYYRESAIKADVVPRADGYVFFGFPDGSISLHPDSLSAAFKRISIRAGVESLHFHSLRHFSATQLIAAGVDVRTVANRLGHADPSMTLRVYSHALEQKDKDAASILGGIIGKK